MIKTIDVNKEPVKVRQSIVVVTSAYMHTAQLSLHLTFICVTVQPKVRMACGTTTLFYHFLFYQFLLRIVCILCGIMLDLLLSSRVHSFFHCKPVILARQLLISAVGICVAHYFITSASDGE